MNLVCFLSLFKYESPFMLKQHQLEARFTLSFPTFPHMPILMAALKKVVWTYLLPDSGPAASD